MVKVLGRRALACGALALTGLRSLPGYAVTTDDIAAIERRHGGRLGVFVLDTGSGRTLAHRADERFLLCSTFKGPLAALVLARVDAGQDSLSSSVRYGRKDLLPASPVTEAHVGQGALPVGALCEAILQYSDNAAANLLMARVGGPAAVTRYVRTIGDQVTRIDRYELAAGENSGDLDTTTPRAIAATARTIALGDVLKPASRALMERWMGECARGKVRLRASFPRDWVAFDRTGTADGECNDYAIARRPGRAPLVVAAYYDRDAMGLEAQEAVLREVGGLVADWAG